MKFNDYYEIQLNTNFFLILICQGKSTNPTSKIYKFLLISLNYMAFNKLLNRLVY